MAMYCLVLVLAAAALVGGQPANFNNHNPNHQQLLEIDKHKGSDEVPAGRRQPFIKLVRNSQTSVEHRPGTTLELTCEAIAGPAPSVHWFKNDAPVYEYDKESSEIIASNPTSVARISSTLLVSRTDAPARYTCLVVAGPNTARRSTLVYSTDGSPDSSERSKLVPLAPRVLVSYRVLVDLMGHDVVLPCRVRGHPRPAVAWTDDRGQDVANNPRMKVLRSGDLTISSLRWTDLGQYTCHATNLFGSAEITTFVYPAIDKKAVSVKKNNAVQLPV